MIGKNPRLPTITPNVISTSLSRLFIAIPRRYRSEKKRPIREQ